MGSVKKPKTKLPDNHDTEDEEDDGVENIYESAINMKVDQPNSTNI
jgi:hypothetical protein